MPLALVVKSGSKTLARCSSGIPSPVSMTETAASVADACALQPQGAAAGHRLHRVVEQVGNNPLDLGGVGLDVERILVQLALDLDLRRDLDLAQGLPGGFLEREAPEIGRSTAGVVEELADDAVGTLDLRLDAAEPAGSVRSSDPSLRRSMKRVLLMIDNGVRISWATPPASSPRVASFSLRTSCSWASSSSRVRSSTRIWSRSAFCRIL